MSASEKLSESQKLKIVLLLGGTRGIGKATTKLLAQQFKDTGIVYFTARNDQDGQKVMTELGRDGVSVQYLVFDLADEKASQHLAHFMKERHGGVDILVQNGGYAPGANRPPSQDARPMIQTNNHGTLRVLQGFLPVLREEGRLVIVASGMGRLERLPVQLRSKFFTAPNSSSASAYVSSSAGSAIQPDFSAVERIERVMDEYVSATENGTAAEQGWPVRQLLV